MKLCCEGRRAGGRADMQAGRRAGRQAGSAQRESLLVQAALKGAVSLCKRHSRDAAPAAAQELWFSVLQRYVALLRRLRQLARQPSAGPVPPKQAQRLAAAQVMHPRRVMRLQVSRPFHETNADHLRLLQLWLGACCAQDRASVARMSS